MSLMLPRVASPVHHVRRVRQLIANARFTGHWRVVVPQHVVLCAARGPGVGRALTPVRFAESPAPVETPRFVPAPAVRSSSAEEMRSAMAASAHYDRLYVASHADMLIDDHGC